MEHRRNSRRPLFAWVLFAALASVVLVGLVRAQGLVGWTSVHVQDDDIDFAIHLPTVLARVALVFVPNDVWRDARAEIGPWGPAVSRAVEELERCDDAVLVQVESGREVVNVEKRGGRFVVSVSTPSEQVDVRIPTGLVRAVWGRIADERVS